MRAQQLLERCATASGFVASLDDRDNYKRVWARDGCICAIAVHGDPALEDVGRATLATLANHCGPSGQIPSNVGHDVSYGKSAGRVDATIWFIIAARLYGVHADVVAGAERVLRAWEHNDAGLVYVPVSGDWADEYVLGGYLLYDNALRVWAAGAEADRIPMARFIEGERFIAGFHAGETHRVFDAFGCALCCMLDIGPAPAREAALEQAASLGRRDLVPAFWPPIEPGEARYAQLEHAAAGKFRNSPGRYHNGGLWPMLTGFWARAARHMKRRELADRWLAGIQRVNAELQFPEYVDANTGEPGGTRNQAWSAAAELIASE